MKLSGLNGPGKGTEDFIVQEINKVSENQPAQNSAMVQILMRAKGAIAAVIVLSIVINVLVLNGSIYMMLVYDRALPSANLVTLFGLFGMATVIYIAQAYFELIRGNLLSDLASTIDEEASLTAAFASHHMALRKPEAARTESPLQDLEQVRSFLAGTGPVALIDLPWVIFFLAILTMLHVWLGVAAIGGAIVMVLLTIRAEVVARKNVGSLTELGQERQRMIDRQRQHVEVLTALGMRDRFARLVHQTSLRFADRQRQFGEQTSKLATASKSTRMFIQSALLTVGTMLVLKGEASGGVIFASSILSGRALAPVDQAIGQWRAFARTRVSWKRLNASLQKFGAIPERTSLPLPAGAIEVRDLVVAPPGSETATVQGVSFAVPAGSVVGVTGPSGSGKSTLIRALVGAWPMQDGTIRFDGATPDQWDTDRLGAAIGYLPQSVELLAGTIAQNIARFDPAASSDSVLGAATAAAVHDLIVKFPAGYDTEVGEAGAKMSGGQRQRIGLARALYGTPSIIILDEPNSNLDPSGAAALSAALAQIKSRGATAIVVTHREELLNETTHILRLNKGKVAMFGTTSEVVHQLRTRANAAQASKVAAHG